MDSAEESQHQARLSECCRVCGCFKRRKHWVFRPVDAYSNEIFLIYQIDISKDETDIHPRKICNACHMKFLHFRIQKTKTTSFDIKVPKIYQFEKHSSDCQICNRQAGRPSSKHNTLISYSYCIENTGSVRPDSDAAKGSEQTQSTVDTTNTDQQPFPFQIDSSLSMLNNDTSSTLFLASNSFQKQEPGPSTSSLPTSTVHYSSDTEDEAEPKKFKRSSVFDVTKALDFSAEKDFLDNPPFTEITSIPIDRAIEKSLADIIQCSICQGIPTEPVVTICSHIFCRPCLSAWLKTASACPVCRAYLDHDCFDVLRGQLALMYDTLHVTCTYDNCQSILLIKDVKNHENICKFGKYPVLMTSASNKQSGSKSMNKVPIYDCKAKYVRQKRLKPLIDSVNNFCRSKNENKCDVLFFMTLQHLRSTNDDRAHAIECIWREPSSLKLTAHQCLAIRIDTLQSKAQYRSQYEFLKAHGSSPFQSPHMLDNIECQYAPASVRYSLEGHEFGASYYHTPMKCNQTESINVNQPFEPIDILSDFSPCLPELATPNVKGCRWQYPDALAKTLAELEPDILKGLEENNIDSSDPTLLLKTYVKDGADGLGDVSVHKEVSDRFLPDKAFRFSFCIFKIEASVNNGEFSTIFIESKPNSVRTNRPLLEAICDENNHASSTLCLLGIENERMYMKNKILRVQTDSGWRRHVLYFTNSMIDEKLDRANSGLAGSGSAYLCTLCDATRETAVSQLGTFSINRTYDETSQIAQYVRLNPDNLKKADLDKLSKGVKCVPLLTADAIDKGLDATHADINCGSFIKKIIVREIAEINKWDMTEDVKGIIKDAEVKFDMHVKKTIGINPQLMMPGNYSRMLFDETNESHLIHLIRNDERKKCVKMLLEKFRAMRTVYRATDPKVQYPQKTKLYKDTAIQFGRDLIDNFEYARWPNYIHKVIEHVQELIENPNGPGTVGGLSGEGNEGGNKIFRHFRLHLARKGSTYGGLRDVLWVHWLYSSPKLVKLAAKSKMQQRCTCCKSKDHNIRTCPFIIK